jgi:hypothetical protein
MKHTISKLFFAFLTIFIFTSSASAQEELKGLKQLFDITIDPLGNANVAVSMKLNASQWDAFKSNVGNNTSTLKRGMEDALPKYFLANFNYTEDQMQRTYTMKFDVQGFCTNDKNGKWTSKLDSKDPDITKLSDREFVLAQNIVSDGMLLQQTQKIHLPSSASNAKIEKDSFGKALLTYTIGTPLKHTIITALGVLLILGGGFFFYRNQSTRQNNLKVAKEQVAA